MTEKTTEAGGYLNDAYQWTRELNTKTPYLNGLNPEFLPSSAWISDFVRNNSNLDAEEIVETLPKKYIIVYALFVKLDNEPVEEPEKRSLDTYFECLVDKPEDLTPCRDIDLKKKIFISDKAFAQYRLTGPNPTAIRPATVDDLEALVPELKEDDEMTKLAQTKQLFVVDYSYLAKLKVGRSFVEGFPKAALGSVALFKQHDKGLAPVCVRVISPTGQSKLFRPDGPRGPKHNGFGWEIAKCIVNSNDAYVNQSVNHLARGHLIAEIFLVATYRRFRPDHPLYKLLTPHVEGTAFINDVANNGVFSKEGTFDVLPSFDYDDTRQQLLSFLESFFASDLRFPARLKARQMDVDSVPGLDYPFRDDGLLIWEALRRWVANYVQIFYPNDDAVAADTSVRNWIEELKTNGGVRWLDNFEYTVDWLSDVIASFICLSTLDHSTVHYAQRDHLQFMPAFSVGIYGGDSVVFKDKPTEDDYLALLPPKAVAKSQSHSNFAFSFIYTRLGHYDAEVPWNTPGDHFKGLVGDDGLVVPDDYLDRVNEALLKFQRNLDTASEVIQQRNESRASPYTILLPCNLPQSLNV